MRICTSSQRKHHHSYYAKKIIIWARLFQRVGEETGLGGVQCDSMLMNTPLHKQTRALQPVFFLYISSQRQAKKSGNPFFCRSRANMRLSLAGQNPSPVPSIDFPMVASDGSAGTSLCREIKKTRMRPNETENSSQGERGEERRMGKIDKSNQAMQHLGQDKRYSSNDGDFSRRMARA